MSDSPSHHGSAPPSASSGASGQAPRSRRPDYVLTAVVGAIFAPVTSVLLGLADAAPTQILRTALLLAAILLLSASAAALFASRSSLGALVAGLTALAAQSMVFLAPIHAASLSEKWLQSLIRTGFVLVLAGLWLGGSWGMRQARRAGHAQGHAAFRLTQADRTVGSTPTPPPSRRRDHLLSLPWVVAGLALAAFLLPRSYMRAVAPGIQTGPLMLAAVLVSFIALSAAGASTAHSTLGARVTGPILILVAVPKLSGDMIPGGHLVSRLLPYGPDAVVLAAIGIELMAIGWGAHMARRQGRANALARLRSGA
ncbi:hypothetical protein [Actinomyces naeslundii]|uniref:hypothetical protein n=1 Tax=Actinomyces naeslundii TaxID=1655 RepID=UPI002115F115|nr:hypothetical protein [Actinomyces naeslundii]